LLFDPAADGKALKAELEQDARGSGPKRWPQRVKRGLGPLTKRSQYQLVVPMISGGDTNASLHLTAEARPTACNFGVDDTSGFFNKTISSVLMVPSTPVATLLD
jgi:hypothetical protein